jgi:16S rRNA (uracil1498-N3)-methyltransferase
MSERDGIKTPIPELGSREHRFVHFKAGVVDKNAAEQEKDEGADNTAPWRNAGPERAQATLFYMARRRFFVDEVRGGRAQIEGGEAHHLTRVLRVEPGQKYEISDNHDVYLAEIESARKDLVRFAIIEKISSPESSVHITAAASLIKFDRFEWMIEKATELGVEAIVPFVAERTEKGLDLAAAKRLDRWCRIARESSEQSRRVRIPQISAPVSFPEALALQAELRLALEEQPGAQPIVAVCKRSRSIALLAGPEGGWTDRERAIFTESGWTPVSLGPTILRSETAVIAAISVIAALSHDCRLPTPDSLPATIL